MHCLDLAKLGSAALAVAALAALPFLFGSASKPPGPGAVLAMHEELFRALDQGNAQAVRAFLVDQPAGAAWSRADDWGAGLGFLAWAADPKGKPLAAEALDEGARTLGAWVVPGASTRVVRAWTDCHSAELSFAALELERSVKEGDEVRTERWRSTSLVSYSTSEGRWRLWQIHLSRAL
jgi:hypothetical protein